MPTTKLAAWAIDGAVLAVVILLAWLALSYFGGKAVDTIQAPAKLDAALGNNAALAAGIGVQNKAVDALKADGEKRQAKSAAAVADGRKEAARIQSAPCTWGKDDYDCANGRIDRELGLK